MKPAATIEPQGTGSFRVRSSVTAPEGAPFKNGEVAGGRYELRDVLGFGPLGVVYRALDREIDVEVAFKAFYPGLVKTDEERKAFTKEMRGLKKLSHANLGRVYEEGLDKERPFFTSQMLEGLSLRRIIELRQVKGQLFDLHEVDPILIQLASVLDYLHETAPHADLKPENIIILPDLLKVTDFGLARSLPRDAFLAAQKSDRYIAPELRDGKPYDARADIYALGVIFGEMLASAFPKDGVVPDLRRVNPAIPESIQNIYLRALHPDPAARYPRASDFASEVSAIVHTLPEPVRPEPKRPPPPGAVIIPVQSGSAKPPPPPEESLEGDPQVLSSGAIQIVESGVTDLSDSEFLQVTPAAEVGGAKVSRTSRGDSDNEKTQLIPYIEEKTDPALKGLRISAAPEPAKSAPAFGRVSEERRGFPIWIVVAIAAVAAIAVAIFAPRGDKANATAPVAPAPVASVAALDAGVSSAAVAKAEPAKRPTPTPTPKPSSPSKPPAPVKVETPKPVAQKVEPKSTEPAIVAPATPSPQAPAPSGDALSAKVAFCPPGMVQIASGGAMVGSASDDPMRNFGDRDLKKVQTPSYCIDLYEYPNAPRAMPQRRVTYWQAEKLCKDQQKRLCSEDEWERACKGPANHRFPYGAEFDDSACNTQDAAGTNRSVAVVGAFERCKSGYGVYDLSGNLAEWTSSRFQPDASERTKKGGAANRPDFDDRCAARAMEGASSKGDFLGFRCCADAK